jgi:hypothetical protein
MVNVPSVLRIWEPEPPGTLWATPGLLRDCVTFALFYIFISYVLHTICSEQMVRLRLLACWDCRWEFRRVHGCLSLVSVGCCHLESFESGWSLVQRSPSECGVSECDREAPYREAMTRNRVEAPQGKSVYSEQMADITCTMYQNRQHTIAVWPTWIHFPSHEPKI